MEAIKDTLFSVIKKLDAQRQGLNREDPEVILKKVLAKNDFEHVKFSYFKKGVLGIKVDSSTRLYHLSLRKKKILSAIGKDIEGIKELRFYIGEVK